MENRRKSEENEMQLKAGQKAWKISKTKISQTVRKPVSQCENFRNTQFAMRKFRKANFAVRNSISQCQNTIHLSQPMRNFALRNSQRLCEISQTHFALRNSLPLRNSISQTISHCQIHPAKFTGLVILCN